MNHGTQVNLKESPQRRTDSGLPLPQGPTLMARNGDHEHNVTLTGQSTSQASLNTPPSVDGSVQRSSQYRKINHQLMPLNTEIKSLSQLESQRARSTEAHSQVLNQQPSTSRQTVDIQNTIETQYAGPRKQAGNNLGPPLSQKPALMLRNGDHEHNVTLTGQSTSQASLNTPPPPFSDGSVHHQEHHEGYVTLAAESMLQVPPHHNVQSSLAHGGSRFQVRNNHQLVPANPQPQNNGSPKSQYQHLSQTFSQDSNSRLPMRQKLAEFNNENSESIITNSYQGNNKSYHQRGQPNQRNKKFRPNSYNQRMKGVEKAAKSFAATEERLRELEKKVKIQESKELVSIAEVKSNQALMSAVTHMSYPTPPQSPQIPANFMAPSTMYALPTMQHSLKEMHSLVAGISPMIQVGAMQPMASTIPPSLSPITPVLPFNSGLSTGMPTIGPIIHLNPNLRRNMMSSVHPYVFDPYNSHYM